MTDKPENPPAYLERLRDEFAMAALQGWLASFGDHHEHPVSGNNQGILAAQSYALADAMLAARQGGGHD